jgi:hypothetical protein
MKNGVKTGAQGLMFYEKNRSNKSHETVTLKISDHGWRKITAWSLMGQYLYRSLQKLQIFLATTIFVLPFSTEI